MRKSAPAQRVILAGAVIGALVFGYGTDRFGRKKFFFITVCGFI